MLLLDQVVDTCIAEAMERGEFDNLPGKGKPLALDDDRHVPKELRVAYRLLKNAGFAPPEVELRRDISRLEDIAAGALDAGERGRAARRLSYLNMQLSLARRGKLDLRVNEAYYHKLQVRLGRCG
jgi:hypothetical protein